MRASAAARHLLSRKFSRRFNLVATNIRGRAISRENCGMYFTATLERSLNSR
jgi:hypothetical protein